MGETNHKLIRESLFNSYKSYMEFLRLANETNLMYNILVLRKQANNNLVGVSIIINSIDTNDENHNYNFKINVTLTNKEAQRLIEDIRIDFRDNHYVSYCTVNPSNSIQRLQNTNFSLNIKLLNEEEQEEALKFNDSINRNGERHKVLRKK